jgi:hypothetical protein
LTNALAERTETVTLDQYRDKKYNVLVPTQTITQISPFHRLRIEEVKIDPNPDAGDVFKVGSKKVGNNYEDVLSLSKNALMKIANAAGIVWNWNETKVITATRDYVLYQAVGAFRKPSGEWLPLKASKEIDLTIIEEETREANREKAFKLQKSSYESDRKKLEGTTPEQWAAAQTKSAMIQWRKNKLMRAETGAMLRVVRALLSIKQQYSPAELTNPFAVPHVDFSPDYTDPEVRKMVMEHGLRATADLFGAAAAPQPQLTEAVPHQVFTEEEFDDNNFTGDSYEDGDDADHAHPTDPEPDHASPPSSGNANADPVIECDHDGCGKILSKAEINYSQAYYDRFLCISHQKLYKKVTG